MGEGQGIDLIKQDLVCPANGCLKRSVSKSVSSYLISPVCDNCNIVRYCGIASVEVHKEQHSFSAVYENHDAFLQHYSTSGAEAW